MLTQSVAILEWLDERYPDPPLMPAEANGRAIVRALARQSYLIKAACRRTERAEAVRTAGDVGQIMLVRANLRIPASVSHAIAGSQAVINAAGIPFQRGRQRYQAVHVEGARAIAEAPSLLTGQALERVLQTAFQHLANSDPARAAELVDKLPPGDVQTLVTMDVARALAMRDVPAALAWVKTLPIEFAQWLATTNILFVWGSRDLPAAARYVTDMPPGGGLDYIAGQFANFMARQPRDGIGSAGYLHYHADYNTGTNTIHSGPEHPSHLLLPVIPKS